LLQQSESLESEIARLQEVRERRLESLLDLESKLEALRKELVVREARLSMANGGDISLQRIEKLSKRVHEYEREKNDRCFDTRGSYRPDSRA
jgi:hypothetical protein